ncbi:MAG: type III-A CRISPR-associated protein Csm2 [Lachnospiraceae bacterium]|jgi:CRISPR type III-A-associated protein Csm2|nr:type III-A CRISPR-associated protein Csm2 [Lachnospiraceae bacterium]
MGNNESYSGKKSNNNNCSNTQEKEYIVPIKGTELDYAERIIKYENNRITTTQLNNMLILFVNVKKKLETCEGALSKEQLNILKYIKVKLVYQFAKLKRIDFLEKTTLLKMLDAIKTKDDFNKVVQYVEAIIAYNKFYKED